MKAGNVCFFAMLMFCTSVISRVISAPIIVTSPYKFTVKVSPTDTVVKPPVTPKQGPIQTKATRTDVFLDELLKTRPEFKNIMDNRDSLKVQIIYTRIDRNSDNTPTFTPYYFNVNSDNYFYPGSTVKMPVALMALQRLNELKVFGLNSHSSMITENSYNKETPVFNDPTTPDGRPSIDHYIKKIFLVSDNDAFNRLYELLGQQYINERFHTMGYDDAVILHRLAVSLSEDENRHTNGIKFFSETGKPLYSQPMQVSTFKYPQRSDSIGTSYMINDTLVNGAMRFSDKNKLGLEDLTSMLKSILFPTYVPQKQRFNVKPEDYRFVYKYMSQFPGETLYPSYDSTKYQDAYLKFLLYGSQKDTLPKNIRIFNKSGNAYGFLTDIAYIVDFEKNIEFMLSATIYCNSDGIVNDDKYDYESVGLPFLKSLGKLIYDYESKRERKVKPDLSTFKIKYDK